MSLHLHPAVQLSFAIWANILMIAMSHRTNAIIRMFAQIAKLS